ncbi:YccT family protein [Enterovibrio baiacu]|uniref:YccT family protein n=1 Tax=Enterovibrio baiacu TaxID=2491023 RepID=UPI003D0A6F9D
MKKMLLAVAIVLFPFFSTATELDVGQRVELMVLNGEKVADKSATHILLEGKNQIVVRVYGSFRSGSDEELVTSSPYIFTFDSIKNSDTISLSLPSKINNLRKVEKALLSGEFGWVLLEDGKNLSYSVDKLPGNGGFIPYSNIESLVSDYNKSKGISISSLGLEDLNETAVTVLESGEIEITGDPITQLKLWYTKATKEERKTFRKWMIDQE